MAAEQEILYEAELQRVEKHDNQVNNIVVRETQVSWTQKDESSPGKAKGADAAAEDMRSGKVKISWILKTAVVEDASDSNQSKLSIHYVTRNLNKDHTSDLSLAEMTFSGAKETCAKVAESIQSQITKTVPNRPKRLLVIINPMSGKRKGETIYRTKVAPIFDLCGIKVDVVVTKRAKHSDEILDQYDLSTVDGVIAMGGDGTLTEVVSALLRRTAKDAGIDENDPDVVLKTPSVTISMISAGSANGHPLYAAFSKKPVSSALVIAIGHTQPMDVVTVHSGRNFVAYDLLLLGYGQSGRIMSMMENNRWAGPARYLALPFCVLISRKIIQVEVDYLPSETPSENPSEKEDKSSAGNTDGATAAPAWQTVSADVAAVDMTTINPWSPTYCKSYFIQSDLGDGNMCIWLTRSCGRMEQLGFWNKVQKFDHTAFDANFIEKHLVKAYRVRATGAWKDSKDALTVVWDGDMVTLPEPHYEVKNHQGTLTIFTRDDGEELRTTDPKPTQSS